MQNDPGVTYINGVLGGGHLNGVVNLQLGVCHFENFDEAGKVSMDMAIAARLRMDVLCARNLYQYLGELLKGMEALPISEAQGQGVAESAPAEAPPGKPN